MLILNKIVQNSAANFSKMSNEISVIICTHNPRMDYLERVLGALREQSFSLARWELLLIDNKSEEPLSGRVDLSWHPTWRVIREEEIGLTNARLRAIEEAQAELLLFLDDDNEVFSDYLEEGLSISSEWPKLGAWGGQWIAEFELGRPAHLKVDIFSTPLTRDLWSNNYDRAVAPFGGGMFLRSEVAKEYARKCIEEPLRKKLDRAGGSLASYGDIDMAFTACDLGLGMGRFQALKITHLIPSKRTSLEYLLKIREDSEFSDVLFQYIRGINPSMPSRIDTLVSFYKKLRLRLDGKNILEIEANERGRKRAFEFLKNLRE